MKTVHVSLLKYVSFDAEDVNVKALKPLENSCQIDVGVKKKKGSDFNVSFIAKNKNSY